MGRRKNRPRKPRERKQKNETSSKVSSCSLNFVLPEDIIVEILSRLSLDSLARLTGVSKQWHRLISSISVTKRGSSKVLLASYSHGFSADHLIDQHQQEVCRKSLHIPWTMSDLVTPARFLGSCNGLLLMASYGYGGYLFLWNPLTRYFKKVAFAPLWMDDMSGLCYDSTTDDYKAVLTLYNRSSFLVVSFKNQSRAFIPFPYKMSKIRWPLHCGYKKLIVNSGLVVNAKLHWFVAKNDPVGERLPTHQIMYFDAHVEKFEEVPMPKPTRGDTDIILELGALDGCLCMSRHDYTRNNVEVLVMKEYGVKNSWTSLFVVSDWLGLGPSDVRLQPLGYTKNGEVLAAVRRCWLRDKNVWLLDNLGCDLLPSRWYIRAYNPTDNSYRSISTPMELHFCPIAYEESLIAPSYDWEEEESKKGEATYL